MQNVVFVNVVFVLMNVFLWLNFIRQCSWKKWILCVVVLSKRILHYDEAVYHPPFTQSWFKRTFCHVYLFHLQNGVEFSVYYYYVAHYVIVAASVELITRQLCCAARLIKLPLCKFIFIYLTFLSHKWCGCYCCYFCWRRSLWWCRARRICRSFVALYNMYAMGIHELYRHMLCALFSCDVTLPRKNILNNTQFFHLNRYHIDRISALSCYESIKFFFRSNLYLSAIFIVYSEFQLVFFWFICFAWLKTERLINWKSSSFYWNSYHHWISI